jgi:hypothetical protein
VTRERYLGLVAALVVGGLLGGLLSGAIMNYAPAGPVADPVIPPRRTDTMDVLKTRRLILVDDDGRVLAELGAHDTRNPDSQVTQRDSTPILRFFDSEGRDRVWLGINAAEEGGVVILGNRGLRTRRPGILAPACGDKWGMVAWLGVPLPHGHSRSHDVKVSFPGGGWSPWECQRRFGLGHW